jgi:hypothetical protein
MDGAASHASRGKAPRRRAEAIIPSMEDRLLIGRRIYDALLARWEANSLRLRREQLDCPGIEEARQKLGKLLPLSKRQVVLETQREWHKREEVAPRDQRPREPASLKKLPNDVAEAVRLLHHLIWDELNGRQRLGVMVRPQGELNALISNIVADESRKRGITITKRQGRRWLDLFRAEKRPV